MNKQQLAIANFETMNCNQAVLAAFGPDYGLSTELCFKLGLSFGGGMGRQGKTCGVVTGAYLVIGMWCSEQLTDKQAQKNLAAQKVKEFNTLFVEKTTSLECKTLLNYDLSIVEESQKASDLKLFDTLCPKFVGFSVEILESILL